MKKIYKYAIQHETNVIEMPKGAEIISCQTQYNKPTLWVLVDPDETETVERLFESLMTGSPIETADANGKVIERNFLGTCLVNNGNFVAHIFEVIPNELEPAANEG